MPPNSGGNGATAKSAMSAFSDAIGGIADWSELVISVESDPFQQCRPTICGGAQEHGRTIPLVDLNLAPP
jgi:hypothetical protein